MDGLADGATLDRRRSRRYLRLWCYRQCLGDARAELRLGRLDDSSRLGCCRAVMPVLSLFLAGAVDLGNCHMLFYHLFKWPSTCLNPARVCIPVIADGDTGYGDLHNVQRTVEAFEAAGVSGILLEDQVD